MLVPVALSLKLTVPALLLRPTLPGAGVTSAVNVSGWLRTDGFTDEVTVVLVLAGFTVWLSDWVLFAKLGSPL